MEVKTIRTSVGAVKLIRGVNLMVVQREGLR